jgi:H+-translocating NAD(P) transhydrogenase subunit beta
MENVMVESRMIIMNLIYLISALMFAFGIKMLGKPMTARKGNVISSIGMLLAVLATLICMDIITYQWIVIGLVIGGACGYYKAERAAMTEMPQTVALLHGFGGLAALLVDWVAFDVNPTSDLLTQTAIYLSIVIGGITFTGSLVAWGKLSEKLPGRSITFPGIKFFNALAFLCLIVAGAVFLTSSYYHYPIFLAVLALSFILGLTLVLPIGGADMPVVISVLNSYSGLVACTTGFALRNILLIVTGAFVGANGVILSIIMCKAMNRSLVNVLFGGFGASSTGKSSEEGRETKSLSVEDAFYVLESAKSVVIIPGYGLAAAQAQHAVRELQELLEENGCEVKYAIHPVAGRMPGHMNVLLAEASISYDALVEMDDINPQMSLVDVAIIIGANDVVNPAALTDESSPIYGMPIIRADQAKQVFVLKRSMASGFAGIPNPLFYADHTSMIFGDAKNTLQALASEFKVE